MKMNRKFNTFTDLKSLKLKVPKICLVIECVSARRDRRYGLFNRGLSFYSPSMPSVLITFIATPSIIIFLLETIASTSLNKMYKTKLIDILLIFPTLRM
jgi:hypothetical protein